jgi:hypothetical protein
MHTLTNNNYSSTDGTDWTRFNRFFYIRGSAESLDMAAARIARDGEQLSYKLGVCEHIYKQACFIEKRIQFLTCSNIR